METLSKWTKRLVREQRGITGMETAIILIAFVVVASVFAFAVLSTGLFTSDKSKETIQAGLAQTRSTLETKGSARVSATRPAVVAGIVGNLYTSAGAALAAGATSGFLPHKPILPGSEKVYFDCDGAKVLKTEGIHYTNNFKTGEITFTPALVLADLSVCADYTWYKINSITVPLAISPGGVVVDLTPGVAVVGYSDPDTSAPNIFDFTLTKLGSADADNLLEPGELIEMTITTCRNNTVPAETPVDECLDGAGATPTPYCLPVCASQTTADLNYGLTSYDTFRISIATPTGAVLTFERTIPSNIEPVMDMG